MKRINIVIFIILLSNSFFVLGENTMQCRQIHYKDTKFCSISFYELLANSQKFDGLNIRITGYLKYDFDSNSAVLSIDLVSLEGTLILDNVVGIDVDDKLKKIYREQSGELVEVFGKYNHDKLNLTMIRGKLESIALLQKHL